jgi:hypothetical protein
MDVGEAAIFLTWKVIEAWPITAWGTVSQNFDAKRSALFPFVDDEGRAWSAGLEIGDKAQWLKLGAGFFSVEANAFPSMLIDSDTLDGITNREGFAFYASRQLFKNTDLNVTFFNSHWIESETGLGPSLQGSDRLRGQVDVEVKF